MAALLERLNVAFNDDPQMDERLGVGRLRVHEGGFSKKQKAKRDSKDMKTTVKIILHEWVLLITGGWFALVPIPSIQVPFYDKKHVVFF